MDITRPFVNVAITTKPISATALAKSVTVLKEAFSAFKPQCVRVFVPNAIASNDFTEGLNDESITLDKLEALGVSAKWDKVLIGNQLKRLIKDSSILDCSIGEDANALPILISSTHKSPLTKQGFTLEIVDFNQQADLYDHYYQSFNNLIQLKPEFLEYAFCNDLDDLCEVSKEGGFNFILKNQGEFAGLISLFTSNHHFAGVQGLYFNEKFIVPILQGQGIGQHFEQWVIHTVIEQKLASPNTVIFGDIDFENKGSLYSALNNGRLEIGRWLLVGL